MGTPRWCLVALAEPGDGWLWMTWWLSVGNTRRVKVLVRERTGRTEGGIVHDTASSEVVVSRESFIRF